MIIEHSNHTFTLLPTPTVKQEQNQKRKREMCEPQITLPPTPPSPFQLHQPTTPPHILKRMETDICFHCKQQGHWSTNCPLKYQNNNSNNHKSLSSSLQIYCRCGHGFCQVKISGTPRNPGREFFTCPIKRGAPCKYFKWCNERIEESDLLPPLFKYPLCECGAGVCKRVKEPELYGFNFKYYFECPIKQDHGSCGFRVSEEELLNNRSIVPFQQTSQRSLDIWEGSQNDTTYKDLVEGGDLLLTTKKMRIIENHSPAVAVSDITVVKDGESPIESFGFPDLKFDDDDDDLDLTEVPLDEIVDSVSSCLSTPSSISHRQSLYKRDIDSCPSQSSKFPQRRPFFCCIFPSFDSIDIPELASSPNGDLAVNTNSISKHDQFSTITHVEASKDVISPNKSPMSQRERKVTLFAQQRLLNDLENFDPHQLESMREAAETTFEMLDRLGFECKQFSNYIWYFINLVSSMAEIDKSMENSPTLEEHNKILEEEKAKLNHIQDDYIKTKASFEALKQQRKTLSEEVRRIETMLHEKQKDLNSCELETMKIETRLCDLKRNELDADTTLKDRVREAEAAREKHVERRKKQTEAKTALEMAKRELEN